MKFTKEQAAQLQANVNRKTQQPAPPEKPKKKKKQPIGRAGKVICKHLNNEIVNTTNPGASQLIRILCGDIEAWVHPGNFERIQYYESKRDI